LDQLLAHRSPLPGFGNDLEMRGVVGDDHARPDGHLMPGNEEEAAVLLDGYLSRQLMV
jgi:hypothetical protein